MVEQNTVNICIDVRFILRAVTKSRYGVLIQLVEYCVSATKVAGSILVHVLTFNLNYCHLFMAKLYFKYIYLIIYIS